MSFNFEGIPYEMKLSVVEKMDIATVARIRQSSRSLKAIIEMNRFKIKARSDKVPIVLKISFNREKVTLVTKVAFKSIKSKEHSQLSYHLGLIPEEEFIFIENPFEQLSAVMFDYVFLDFDFQLISGTYYEIQKNMTARGALFDDVFPLLDNLRLNCDWLCLKLTQWNCAKTTNIVSLINFKKLFFHGQCSFSDVKEWSIQHCNEIHLASLKDVPKRIAPFLKNLNNGSFVFSAEEGIEQMINHFLMEIREDPSVRGNLKKITFVSIGVDYLEEIEGLEIIWEGETVCNEEMIIYKMNIEGGVIYLKLWQESYEMEFLKEERDAEIINEYTSCHCRIPCEY